jgi:hypothetical protein
VNSPFFVKKCCILPVISSDRFQMDFTADGQKNDSQRKRRINSTTYSVESFLFGRGKETRFLIIEKKRGIKFLIPLFTLNICQMKKISLLCLHMALGASGWTSRFVGLLV